MIEAGAEKSRACGLVENIGRSGTRSEVCTLGELMEKKVNMFTTVFIGNSQSEILEIKKNRVSEKDSDNCPGEKLKIDSERKSENILERDSAGDLESKKYLVTKRGYKI